MPLFRPVLTRLREETMLIILLLVLGPLLWFAPIRSSAIGALVDWRTIGALAGLMVLSRGLEDSGYLSRAGHWLMNHMHSERWLAVTLVMFSAALSAVITNDVALFIVVPLTLSLRRLGDLPVGRLIIFEALAVNAGSTLSPIGNPQNLYLWQQSGTSFFEFTQTMLPLSAGLTALLLLAIPLGFSHKRLIVTTPTDRSALHKPLLWCSLACYPLFLALTDLGYAGAGAIAVTLFYLIAFRHVLLGVDWLLLGVFILMFIDLGLLASLPVLAEPMSDLLRLPGGFFTAGILTSQFMSNVPATIFLTPFSDDWQRLAWGVNVGGFGLAIGSMANLIALRLARQPGLGYAFHLWSIPMLVVSALIAVPLITLLP